MSKETSPFQRGELLKEPIRDVFSLLYYIPRFEVYGQKCLEIMRDTAVIIVFFPHCGHPDGPGVRKAIPRGPRKNLLFPAAADYWFDGSWKGRLKAVFGSFIVRSFPLSRAGSGRKVIEGDLDKAEHLLKQGFSLVFAPEGTRTLLPLEERVFHTGIAELVIRTGAPVIPVRLHGFKTVMPKGTAIPRVFEGRPFRGLHRRQLKVVIGEPISFEPEAMEGTRSQKRKEITSQIRECLLAM
jgi:1-acyl-sn-glycerol-3-phosphate acyltransferase